MEWEGQTDWLRKNKEEILRLEGDPNAKNNQVGLANDFLMGLVEENAWRLT